MYPGISGESGSFSKNLSSSLLNVLTLHPFRSLMFLGSELKSFTHCTKTLTFLVVISRAAAVWFKRGSLKEWLFLPPFLCFKSIHFGTRFSIIFQRHIIKCLFLLLSSEYSFYLFSCSAYVRCSISSILLMNYP